MALRPFPFLLAVLLVAAVTLGVRLSAQADLLVSSLNTDSVLRYDSTTGAFLGTFASGGGLNNPVGLTFGPDGHLYVGSAATDSVLRYDGTTGAFLDSFASGGGLDGPAFLVFTSQAQPIPEPSTALLSLVGVGWLVGWRWSQARRQA